MSAANKARGTRFESQVADYLQGQGLRAKRLPRTGVKDIGDLAFPTYASSRPGPVSPTIVIEAKDRARLDWPTYIAEAEAEAQHYEEKFPAEGTAIPVVVAKRRGKGVHAAYVVMPLDGFVEFLRELGVV